jgi:transcriptional regulator with XRE-family HTH domain
MADIGDRIKELRLANHMTQDELAKKLYITRSAVGMYEQGVRRPDFEHMDAMADLFNVSLDYLMGKTNTNIGYPRHFAEALIDATPKPVLMREAEKRAERMRAYGDILNAYDSADPGIQLAVRRILGIS